MSYVTFTLNEYLNRLAAQERRETRQRELPSKQVLAEAAGVHAVNFSRLASNQTVSVNLETLAAIISEFRQRGFDTDIGNLLEYHD